MQTVFSRRSLRALTEAGVMIAMAQLLSYIKLLEMPNGGSVTPASMLPILFFAVRWGPRWGLGAGFTYGLLQFLLDTKFPAPFANQILAYGSVMLLDYLIAFGVLGLAGFFKKRRLALVWGVLAGAGARFAVHYISGLILWPSFAEELPPWLFSLVYNGPYIGAEAAICLTLALLIMAPLRKYIEGRDIAGIANQQG